ncbi:hypothetical protein [Sphingomonas crusticola]|uniref:hypothetical protein n=1 Tax=Sphingomonas crusticola TaxID=1697973 RepID=UPI000E2804E7|nr:hypothetical protein [Sphingomonas crusticola]
MRYAKAWRLALFLLPLHQTGAFSQTLSPPKVYSVSPTGVNLRDLTYTYSHTDLSIGSLSLERSYLGGRETNSRYFGNGWTHNFDIRARYYNNGTGNPRIEVVIARTKYVFTGTPQTQIIPDFDAQGTTLQYTNNNYTFIDRMGTIYQFEGGIAGIVSTITYASGYRITVTNVSSKPKMISDNKGYALILDYGSNGVTAACGFNLANTYVSTSTTCAGATLKTSYGYGPNGSGVALTSFVDTRGYTTSMSYAGWLSCMKMPDSATCQVTNTYNSGNNGHIIQQTLGDGAIWQFGCSCSFDGKDSGEDPAFADDDTYAIDPRGGELDYSFHGLGMVGSTDQNGHQTTMGYTSAQLGWVKPPEGNQVDFLSNNRLADAGHSFHPKTGSLAAPITPDGKTFPTDSDCASDRIRCNLPKTISDGNGNVTSYTYDPVHGGVLTETKPAGSGGISQVVRHHYAQRYAWIKNSAGSFVPASTAVWLPTDDHTCTSGATSGENCVAGSVKEVVTTYEYGPDSGPNNLQLRGKVVTADGQSLRSCYLYDTQGNKIAETSPRAGLATCS